MSSYLNASAKDSGEECSSTMKDDKLKLRDVKNISLLRHAFQKVVERGKKKKEEKSTDQKKNQKNKTETEEKQSSAGKSAAKGS